jgi:UDP-N-acetylmuramate--alanine ligase
VPQVAVVTNLEHDHPDCFPTPEVYLEAFKQFVNCLKPGGLLLVCQDDPGSARLAQEVSGHTRTMRYSALPVGAAWDEMDGMPADYCAVNLRLNSIGCYRFEVWYRRITPQNLGVVSLQVPGLHNVSNALAAFAVVHQMGFSPAGVEHALEEFAGTQRRFDVRGEASGVTVIDDYAHHPVEIEATLEAARKRFNGQRLVAVWQPHTYSRTRMLADAFTKSFYLADRVIVTEVYAAREESNGYSSVEVVDQMSHPDVKFIASLDGVVEDLMTWLAPGDVVIVLSAGDAERISGELVEKLSAQEGHNGKAAG